MGYMADLRAMITWCAGSVQTECGSMLIMGLVAKPSLPASSWFRLTGSRIPCAQIPAGPGECVLASSHGRFP